MKAHCHWRSVLLAGIILVGCSSSKPPGPPRVKTYPVTGIIHVDGKPTAGVQISFYPHENAATTAIVMTTSGDGGKFAATTYAGNDGLPDGTYKMTFVIDETPDGAASLLGNPEFKDGLNGAYSDAKTSTHEVTVNKAKVDLGVIELSTTGAAK